MKEEPEKLEFYKNVSMDLETLGLTTDAVILSIGAVNFDMATGKLGHQFYIVLEHKTQGRYVDDDTMRWWARQNPALIEEVFKGTITLAKGLEHLHKFIRPNQFVWGNGANFDNALIEHAYTHHSHFKQPWKFWNGRDMRTRVADAKELVGFNPKQIKFTGRKHHALYDAAHQAKVISAAYRAIHDRIQGD